MFFFFKQKTAYEMRISDWSSDVCSSDLKVPFQESRLGDGPAELTIGGQAFVNGGDAVIEPSADEATQDLRSEVGFVGLGLNEPACGFDDCAGLDGKGKNVAMMSGFLKGTPREIGAHRG